MKAKHTPGPWSVKKHFSELLAAADQAANGTLLDDALNHDDDDSLRAIAGRISDQWAKKALLAHADRIDAAVTKAIGESQ